MQICVTKKRKKNRQMAKLRQGRGAADSKWHALWRRFGGAKMAKKSRQDGNIRGKIRVEFGQMLPTVELLILPRSRCAT